MHEMQNRYHGVRIRKGHMYGTEIYGGQ